VIDLLNTGALSKSDTIVCNADRKCLYVNLFDNVISYSDFVRTRTREDLVIDLLEPSLFDRLAGGDVNHRLIPYKPFYQNWERDKNEILNIEYSPLENYDMSKPFVALVARKRGAWTEKNMDNTFWDNLVDRLTENSIPTFIFGKEAELFCREGSTAVHVGTFQEWCSIIHHKNCKHVASTMTGALHAALVFGNPESKMTIIDNLQLMAVHGNDPSFYNSCINFSNIEISFINQIPTTKEFYHAITKNL
jgi:hypothetical protein